MSHTIHWSTQSKEHLLPNYGTDTSKFFKRALPEDYRLLMGNPGHMLNLSADVLYPNAYASVCAAADAATEAADPLRLTSAEAEDQVPVTPIAAVGCSGQQLDKEFPLEPRVPIALPLLQYPTPTRNQLIPEEHDACALPVLNWEKYIRGFHLRLREITRVYPLGQKVDRKPFTDPSKSIKIKNRKAKARLNYVYNKRDQSEVARIRGTTKTDTDGEVDEDEDKDSEEESSETDFDADVEEALKISSPTKNRIDKKIKADINKIVMSLTTTPASTAEDTPKLRTTQLPLYQRKHIEVDPPNFRRNKIRNALARALVEDHDLDPEEEEKQQRNKSTKSANGTTTTTSKNETIKKEDVKLLVNNLTLHDLHMPKDRERISLSVLRRYTRQPEYKIQGTWNYLYSGHGACDWICDAYDKSRRHVLVGHGTKLRVASIKPSSSKRMLSYTLDGVWEEESVPTNVKPGRTSPNEQVSDLILQIVAARRGGVNNCLGAVRRGRSIEIYRLDETPSLVTSIANVFYGTNKYKGYERNIRKEIQGNPVLQSFDLNPWFPEELTMLDENNILTFVDFARGKTFYQISPATESHTSYNTSDPNQTHIYPDLSLNQFASGITYANHPRTCYFWANSHIYYHDYRTDLSLSTNCLELLNLKSSPAVRAWSNENRFEDDQRHLMETVCAVKQSSVQASTYYHVATTSRVLLMDSRVPGNPVLKMDHGLKSPAAYLDVTSDDHHEIVIAGSQRMPEVFCAVHDHSHVPCADRKECPARYPILASCPRHLSNPTQFFEFAEQNGQTPSWEADHAKAKDHCYGWTTGMAIMRLPGSMKSALKPSAFSVFQGNSFGDIFYQEWDQKPLEPLSKVLPSDPRLRKFLGGWKDAMTANDRSEYRQESMNRKEPANCALLVEIAADRLKADAKVRKEPFNSITQLNDKFESVKRVLRPLEDQVETARRRTHAEIGTEILKVWGNVPLEPDDRIDSSASERIGGSKGAAAADQMNLSESDFSDRARDLTAEERRVLAEIKQEEVENDYEFLDDDNDVEIIDDTGAGARGFELLELEGHGMQEEQGFEFDDIGENEELVRQFYPYGSTEPEEAEVIIPDQVEEEGGWEDVEVSDYDDDEDAQGDNWEEDDEAEAMPQPIPIKINPENLERNILGFSSQSQPSQSQAPQHHQSQSLVQNIPIPTAATTSSTQEFLTISLEDFAVDDPRFFETRYEPVKYDPGRAAAGPVPGPSTSSGYSGLGYGFEADDGTGTYGLDFDPESEALAAQFNQSRAQQQRWGT